MVAKVFVPVRVRISAPFFMYGFSKVLCLNSMQPKSMKYRAAPPHFFYILSRFVYIFRGPFEMNFYDVGVFLCPSWTMLVAFGLFLVTF